MHYEKPPIVEAVIEFRWGKPIDEAAAKAAIDAIAWQRPEDAQRRMTVDAAFDASSGTISQENPRLAGFGVSSGAGEAVIVEWTRFAYLRQAPYPSWDEFRASAELVWQAANSVISIESLSRVSVRFFNRIDVPLDESGTWETDDYITISFNGPREDVGVIHDFQMRVVQESRIPGVYYALAAATTDSPVPLHAGILLDINAFSEGEISTTPANLSSVLDTLRSEKNAIFESCITEASRDLFVRDQ